MLQYDLSNTALARSLDHVQVPTEAELTAIMVALMLAEDRAYAELAHEPLVLTNRNRRCVAAILERQLHPMTRDIGSGSRLQVRLSQLTGLRVWVDPH